MKKNELGQDEYVLYHLRTHWKALFVPVLMLLFIAACFGAGLAWMPAVLKPWGVWALVVLAVLTTVAAGVWPILSWWCATFTLTNRRIIRRSGVLNRVGHDLPLRRISDVTFERDLVDRIFGCGTLVVATAADDPLTFHDVPGVTNVHRDMNELLFSPEADLDDARNY